jgi:hypothetical protein
MISFKKHGPAIKNILHGMASVSFIIWLVGFFGYGLGGWFYGFLGFSLITGLLLIRRTKKIRIPPELSKKEKSLNI